jgi:hypothetical protein
MMLQDTDPRYRSTNHEGKKYRTSGHISILAQVDARKTLVAIQFIRIKVCNNISVKQDAYYQTRDTKEYTAQPTNPTIILLSTTPCVPLIDLQTRFTT